MLPRQAGHKLAKGLYDGNDNNVLFQLHMLSKEYVTDKFYEMVESGESRLELTEFKAFVKERMGLSL